MARSSVNINDIPLDLFLKYFNETNTSEKFEPVTKNLKRNKMYYLSTIDTNFYVPISEMSETLYVFLTGNTVTKKEAIRLNNKKLVSSLLVTNGLDKIYEGSSTSFNLETLPTSVSTLQLYLAPFLESNDIITDASYCVVNRDNPYASITTNKEYASGENITTWSTTKPFLGNRNNFLPGNSNAAKYSYFIYKSAFFNPAGTNVDINTELGKDKSYRASIEYIENALMDNESVTVYTFNKTENKFKSHRITKPDSNSTRLVGRYEYYYMDSDKLLVKNIVIKIPQTDINGNLLYYNSVGAPVPYLKKETNFSKHQSAIRQGFKSLLDEDDEYCFRFDENKIGMVKKGIDTEFVLYQTSEESVSDSKTLTPELSPEKYELSSINKIITRKHPISVIKLSDFNKVSVFKLYEDSSDITKNKYFSDKQVNEFGDIKTLPTILEIKKRTISYNKKDIPVNYMNTIKLKVAIGGPFEKMNNKTFSEIIAVDTPVYDIEGYEPYIVIKIAVQKNAHIDDISGYKLWCDFGNGATTIEGKIYSKAADKYITVNDNSYTILTGKELEQIGVIETSSPDDFYVRIPFERMKDEIVETRYCVITNIENLVRSTLNEYVPKNNSRYIRTTEKGVEFTNDIQTVNNNSLRDPNIKSSMMGFGISNTANSKPKGISSKKYTYTNGELVESKNDEGTVKKIFEDSVFSSLAEVAKNAFVTIGTEVKKGIDTIADEIDKKDSVKLTMEKANLNGALISINNFTLLSLYQLAVNGKVSNALTVGGRVLDPKEFIDTDDFEDTETSQIYQSKYQFYNINDNDAVYERTTTYKFNNYLSDSNSGETSAYSIVFKDILDLKAYFLSKNLYVIDKYYSSRGSAIPEDIVFENKSRELKSSLADYIKTSTLMSPDLKKMSSGVISRDKLAVYAGAFKSLIENDAATLTEMIVNNEVKNSIKETNEYKIILEKRRPKLNEYKLMYDIPITNVSDNRGLIDKLNDASTFPTRREYIAYQKDFAKGDSLLNIAQSAVLYANESELIKDETGLAIIGSNQPVKEKINHTSEFKNLVINYAVEIRFASEPTTYINDYKKKRLSPAINLTKEEEYTDTTTEKLVITSDIDDESISSIIKKLVTTIEVEDGSGDMEWQIL